MITEKDTIKCEAIFNDERTHRFLWKRVWNKEKPLACVVMLNPCMADTIVTDTTTYLVVNNNAPENDGYIKKAAEECDTVILAWGRATDTNLRIAERATEVINLLLPYKEKLCQISGGERSDLHPLTPSVRSAWILEEVTLPLPEEKEIVPAQNG